MSLLLIAPSTASATSFSVDTGRRYPIAPIHFTIITDRYIHSSAAQEHDYNNEATLRHFIKLLNKYFVTKDGNKIIKFKFKSMTSFSTAKATTSRKCRKVVNTGQKVVNLHGAKFNFMSIFNDCLNSPNTDRRIVDPRAINVFIYDAKSRGSTAKDDKDSTGNFNNGQPVLRIDYARIYDGVSWNKAAVFQHEMGHGFNLGHVCNDTDADSDGTPDGNSSTPTNIMSSANSWPSNISCNKATAYGGNRALGFRKRQIRTIQEAARMMQF